jgi:hypothetical protein
MRQSLSQFERAFLVQQQEDQRRRAEVARSVQARTRERVRERQNRRSSMRFYLLILSLVATAAIVTVAMLATLYLLLV